jgi:H+/Cl- antiporter ClcA
MDTAVMIVQIIIALGIFNVWILRFGKSTNWRGGEAQNMKEEFAVYGLPAWFMVLIGFLKVCLAVLLIAGIWVPVLVVPAAIGMAVLMLGAVSMHVKVKDPPLRSLPAFTMLVLSLFVALLS